MTKAIANPGLAKLCRKRDVYVGEVAIFCGCDRTSIYRYVRGRHSPRLEQKMAALFGLSVNQLRQQLGLSGNPRNAADGHEEPARFPERPGLV